MTKKATAYKRNYLSNVILKIDFNPLEKWNDSSSRKLIQEKMKTDFPRCETLKGQDFELIFGPDSSPTVKTNTTREGLRFSDSETKNFVVCDSTSFLYETTIYTNFTDFYSSFEKYFSIYREIFPLNTTKRVGLRYINQIYIPEGGTFELKDYFDSKIIPTYEGIVNNTKPLRLMNISEFSFNRSLLRFQYGMFNSEYPNPIAKKEFVLDYDLYTNEEIHVDSIKDEVQSYNDTITECFENSIGNKLRELMQ
jgi:uncharacterized protein (TIGR04255 family)